MIMDAPCHGRKYHDTDDFYPDGSPEGIVMEDLMKEFCKKEIEFTVIKLDNNCDKMIELMKECHQELEVTDMAEQRPQYFYSEIDYFGAVEEGGPIHDELERLDYEAPRKSKAKKMRKASPKKEGGMFSSMMSIFGGSKKSSEMATMEKNMMAPPLEMSEDEDEMECAPVFESMAPMRGSAAKDFEMKQQMEFKSTAISHLTSQVHRKQANVRSKKAML